MALVLLCGPPCSGKTTVAQKLHHLLTSSGQKAVTIHDGHDFLPNSNNNDACNIYRAQLYADSTAEKQTRARLRAATERAIRHDAVVLCDSLNYIKGFRYELYCVAKTSGVKYAVIHCATNADACLQRDDARRQAGQDGYGHELCAALIRRFEAPAMNRWDKPLYTVDTTQGQWEHTLETLCKQLGSGDPLVATMATKVVPKPHADVLGTLDRLTRQVESVLLGVIRGPVGQTVNVPGATRAVLLRRKVNSAQLRDIRRSFLNLARMHPSAKTSTCDLLDEYIEYLNAQLQPK